MSQADRADEMARRMTDDQLVSVAATLLSDEGYSTMGEELRDRFGDKL